MEIKGTAVKSVREFVSSHFADRYLEWYNSLSNGAKEIIGNSISNQWYPINEGVVEPTIKIGELFYNGDTNKAAFECGMYSAEVALKGVYKIYVKFSSPGHVVDRGSRILPAYYNPSEIKQLERKPQSVKFEMTASKGIDQVVEYRIAGWMQKALEISGCNTFEVKISESIKTHGRTIFDARWNF